MKRAISLFLSILMVVGLFPMNALALELQSANEDAVSEEPAISEEAEDPAEEILPEELPAEDVPLEETPAEEEIQPDSVQNEEPALPLGTTASGSCGTNLTWVLDSDGTLTISGTGAMTNFSSGSSTPWYSYRSSIKKLVLEEGMTSIGKYAFYYYYGNIGGELVIPDSVKTIGDFAFDSCASFSEDVIIGSGVTSLGKGVFDDCSGVNYYFKGDAPSVYNITSGFPSLESTDVVYYPVGNSTWEVSSGKWNEYTVNVWNPENSDDIAYGICGDNLTWVLDSEGTLTISGTGEMDNYYYSSDVPWYSFSNKIKKLVIEDGVASIGFYAFYPFYNRYSNLSGELIIPDSVKSIGAEAFYDCDGFTGELVIPDSVESIGAEAFYDCDGFTGELIIPDSVESIGVRAFRYCDGFSEKATIGSGIDFIGDYSFNNCSANKYYFNGDAPSIYSSINYSGSFDSTDIIYYPMDNSTWNVSGGKWGGYTAYPRKDGTCGDNLTWFIDDEGTLTISGTGNMYNYSYTSDVPWYDFQDSIKKVVIEDGVTSIGDRAFYLYYDYISGKIIIPASVTSIGKYCFQYCSASGYYFEGNAPSVYSASSSYASFDGSDMINYPMDNSTWSVSSGKWNGYSVCSYDPETGLPAGYCGNNLMWVLDDEGTLTISGTGAMTNFSSGSSTPWHVCWDSIKKLVIEDGVTSIGDYAFYDREGITGKLVIPASVTSIGDYAFYYCSIDEYHFTGNAPSAYSAGSSYASFDSSDIIYYPMDNSTWNISDGKWKGYNACSYDPETGSPAGYCGNNLTWVLDDEGTLTISGTGAMTNFSSESSAPWYIYRDSIKKLIVEDGVTSIGDYAFYDYDNITGELIIPDSVTSIGKYVFWGCEGFTGELVIPDSVTSVGDYAFYYCDSFSGKATIGSGVNSVGKYCFQYCSANEYFFKGNAPSVCSTSSSDKSFDSSDCIFYPINNETWSVSNVKWNGYTAFAFDYETKTIHSTCGDDLTWTLDSEGTLTISGRGEMPDFHSESYAPWYKFKSDIKKLVLKNGITNIGSYAFYNYSNITGELSIPRTVEIIGGHAFSGCSGFTGDLIIPDSVTDINGGAFNGCSGFSGKLTLPDSVTFIGISAFENCSGFTGELVIPDSVTTISSYAFYGCSSFSPKAIIGSGVTSIGSKAFKDCPASEYYFKGNAPAADSASSSYPSFDSTDTVYFLKGNSTWSYSSGKWNGYTAFMYDQSGTIFGYCGGNSGGKNLSWSLDSEGTLTISGSGYMADYSASSSAPWNKFSGSLKKLVIESGVTEIGNYAFYGLDNIGGELIIPDSVKTIGNYAFSGCKGFSGNTTIGKGVTSIGNYAFFDCSITDYYFKGSAPTANAAGASYQSFDTEDRIYCPKENTSWVIASGKWNGYYTYMTDYETGTIYGYCGIDSDGKNIEWSLDQNGVFALNGTGAMRNYNSDNSPWYSIRARIKSISISEGITVIGRYAFNDCDNITGELVIPDDVTTISKYAFYGCDGFGKKAAIGSSVSEIGDKAFELCSVSEFYFTGNAPSVLEVDDYFLSFDADDVIYYPKDNESWVIESGKWNGYTAHEYDPQTGTVFGYCGADADGKNLSWTLDVNGKLTIGGSGIMKDYSAENPAPWKKHDIKSIVFDGEITRIGAYAFNNCPEVSGKIIVPDSVTSIGSCAFKNCSVKDFYFTEGQPSVTEEGTLGSFDADDVIYYSIHKTDWEVSEGKWNGYTAKIYDPDHPEYIALGYCGGEENGKNLRWYIDEKNTLTISGSGKMADYESFVDESGQMATSAPWNEYKDSFTALVIEEGITNIGANAFAYLLNLTGNLSLPEGIISIGEKAFNGCSKLSGDLIIPDTVTSIGNNAFGYCYGFKGELVLSKNLETIGNMAFRNCDGFSGKLVIPDSVTEIGEYAFSGCPGFYEEAEIGSGVLKIGNNAFLECGAVNFYFKGNPPSVTSAGESGSFDSDDNLFYLFDNTNWKISGGKWNGYNAKAYDPENPDAVALGLCGAEEGGKNLKWVLDSEGTLTISGKGAMKDYGWYGAPWYNIKEEIKSIILSEGITRIGKHAFYYCYNTQGKLIIPDSVTSIGDYAFTNISFNSLELGKNLETIGYYAFGDCGDLTGELILPDSLITIGEDAFWSCGNLSGKLVIPDSVTSIGSWAFCHSKFTSVSIGKGLETLGIRVFLMSENECFTVSEENPNFCDDDGVLMSKDKTVIFSYPPKKFSEYIIPESVKTIKEYAFYYCSGNIVVDSALDYIEDYAFSSGNVRIYFMNGAPASFESRAFSSGSIELYYLVGTEDKWTFDENGLWNGYTVLPFELNEEVEFDPSLYVDSGYCGKDPLGGKNMAWGIDKNGTLTIFGKGEMADYEQIQSANGNWTTSAPWEKYRESAKKLAIENGVKSIGSYAFDGFYNLTGTLNLPDSIVKIGTRAFAECYGFTGKLIIPEGVVYIEGSAFGGCQEITSAKLPSTLMEIASNAFSYSGIEKIEVSEENGVYSSAGGALLTKDGKGLIMIPYAAKGSFSVPETVETVMYYAVNQNEASEIVLPESVKTIEDYAFNYYYGNVIINSALENVENYAFNWGEPHIYFMDGAPASAGSYAFNGGNIELYYLVGTEDKWTFDENGLWNGYTVKPFDMSGAVEIDPSLYIASGYCGKDPMGGKNMAWGIDKNGTLTILGKGEMMDYTVDWNNDAQPCNYPWAEYVDRVRNVVVEDGITGIGNAAFFRFYNISKITLPYSLREIGSQAFWDADVSDGLRIPENVDTINDGAFVGFNAEWIYIPAKVTYGLNNAFNINHINEFRVSGENEAYSAVDGILASKEKETLVSFPGRRTGEYTIPENFKIIESWAFEGSNLNSIILHENVETINYGAFDECQGSIIIKGQLKKIDESAFSSRNSRILSVYFMNGQPIEAEGIIGNWNNNGKVELYYLKGTEDKWTFDENGKWNGYTVKPFEISEPVEFNPEDYVASGYCGKDPMGGKNMAWGIDEKGVLSIFGSGDMADFSQVRDTTGNWISSAPWGAYYSSINEISVSEGVESIGSYAFYRLYSVIKPVYLPESIKTIGSYAFSGFDASTVFNSRPEYIGDWAFSSWSNSNVNIFFNAGSPLSANDYAFGSEGYEQNLYYLKGTEDLWEFDENGLWNGILVLPYSTDEDAVIFDSSKYVASGYCGFGPEISKNLGWGIDSEGVLHIFGKGLMANFMEYNDPEIGWTTNAPWSKYSDQIERVSVHEGVESIGDNAFLRSNISDIGVLPSTLKTIGSYVFSNLWLSGELVLPEGLIELKDRAFGYQNYTKIKIPSTLIRIGKRAVYGPSLKEFEVAEANPVFCDIDGVLFSKDKKTLVIMPGGITGEYTIPKEATTIGSYAFQSSNLDFVTIPENVKTVNEYAFNGFDGSVVFEHADFTVGRFAFNSYTSVFFMDGAPSLSTTNAFGNSNSPAKLYYLIGTEDKWNFDSNGLWNGYTVLPFSMDYEAEIPSGDNIDSGYCGSFPGGGKNMAWALSSDGKLIITGKGEIKNFSEVQVADDVWGSNAPWGKYYDKITSIEICDGITSIGSFAFYRITLEEAPKIASSVKTISDYAFCNINYDGEFVIPEGVESIMFRAFASCMIDTVSIPSTATYIEDQAIGFSAYFKNIIVSEDNPVYSSVDGMLCSKDGKTVIQFPLGRTGKYTIPEGIETIGSLAFWNSQLNHIIIPESVRVLEDSAFYNVKGLVEFLGQPESIENTAFRVYGSGNSLTVVFHNGAPLNVVPKGVGENGSFAATSGGKINLFYAQGTKEKWTFDENGLWNGYTVKEYASFGDIDGNGKINVLDANLIRRYVARLVELDSRQLLAADVDGNGKINVLDSNLIRRYAAKIIDKFPVEG